MTTAHVQRIMDFYTQTVISESRVWMGGEETGKPRSGDKDGLEYGSEYRIRGMRTSPGMK